MKSLPTTLKIGGHLITVDASKELDGRDGVFDHKTSTITICRTLPKSQQEATLIHEIFHALNSELDNDNVWHALMESLSQQLYQVLSDNDMLK